jgi:hypothetical protein
MVSPYTINHCFLLLKLLNDLMLSKNVVLDQLTVLIMGGRVTPFAPEWRCELPDASKSLEMRSVIFQHRDEVECRRYMYCATKSFSQFLSHLELHPLFFKMSNSVF